MIAPLPVDPPGLQLAPTTLHHFLFVPLTRCLSVPVMMTAAFLTS